MIGMSQIKKKLYTGLAIGLGIGVIIAVIIIIWSTTTIKSYKEETNKSYIAEYMTTVTVLKRDVVQGEIITSDIVTTKKVRKTAVPSGLAGGVVGMVAKHEIAANLPLTSDMFTTELVNSDVRSQEINTVVIPSDLVEGQYIDVRIMYPNGTDYVVLSQKIVEKITDQTIWLQLGEDERLLLNSAIVDSYYNEGTKLYATPYVSETQISFLDYSVIEDNTTNTVDKTNTTDTTNTTDETTVNNEDINTEVDTTITSNDPSVVVKGYLNQIIKEKIDDLKSEDEQVIANTVYNLILQYRNFASIATRVSENYQPNMQVISMMQTNKNIIEEAKSKLSAEARANIEYLIESYETSAGEKYEQVVTGSQESIEKQKEERQTLLGY